MVPFEGLVLLGTPTLYYPKSSPLLWNMPNQITGLAREHTSGDDFKPWSHTLGPAQVD